MSHVAIHKVMKNLDLIRVTDTEVRYFEAMWEIPEGVTYNSYVLHTDEGEVIFDTVKSDFSREYLEALKSVVDFRDIRYVVVHHMEPDHSGSLKDLAGVEGFRAEVLGHPLTSRLIKALLNINVRFREVRDGEEVRLGDTKLKFIHTPWLHWPETMFTYVENSNALMTCDAFGAYSTAPYVVSSVENLKTEYVRSMRKYFANIVGHYRENVVKALDKLGSLGLGVDLVAPSHGAVLSGADIVRKVVELYRSWSEGRAEGGKVVLLYTSMYGYVGKLVEDFLKCFEGGGVRVEVFRFTSTQRDSVADFLGELLDADAFVVATSTYDGGLFPLTKHLLNLVVDKLNVIKPVYLITAYGWSDAAAREIKKILSGSKLVVKGELAVNSTPTSEDLIKLRAMVKEVLAQAGVSSK
ncbi:MAG: FprA family A-type flavoprotein [Zestosphaera sp.]